MRRLWPCAPLVFALVFAVGCSRGERAADHHPVALLGFDGLEWSVLQPLLAKGALPNLKALIARGVAGKLATEKPALSPVIWTSIATGRSKQYHGITSFLSRGNAGPPFTSNARRGKALWNVAGDYGLKTLCVGWWVTWPAEEISGWMVAPYSSAGQNDQNWKGNLQENLEDQTWPRDLIREVFPLARDVNQADRFRETASRYFGVLDEPRLQEKERDLVMQTRWSVSADETFAAVALHMLSRPDVKPDLTLVYLGGTDVSSHRFWRYRSPDEFHYATSDASIAQLDGVIEAFYRAADAKVGALLAKLPSDCNVIVCSDHGFHAAFVKQPDPRGLSGHHLDGPPGVFIAAGPDIRAEQGARVLDGSVEPRLIGDVFNVAPVVLHLLGIPLSRTLESPTGGSLMLNVVKKELLAARPPEATVNSYDEGFRAPTPPADAPEANQQQFQEWMKQLAYNQTSDTVDDQDPAEASRAWLWSLQAAIENYRAAKGELPAKLDDLLATDPAHPEGWLRTPRLPTDLWGHPFRYVVEGGTYRVWSSGRDGVDEGGQGDDILPTKKR